MAAQHRRDRGRGQGAAVDAEADAGGEPGPLLGTPAPHGALQQGAVGAGIAAVKLGMEQIHQVLAHPAAGILQQFTEAVGQRRRRHRHQGTGPDHVHHLPEGPQVLGEEVGPEGHPGGVPWRWWIAATGGAPGPAGPGVVAGVPGQGGPAVIALDALHLIGLEHLHRQIDQQLLHLGVQAVHPQQRTVSHQGSPGIAGGPVRSGRQQLAAIGVRRGGEAVLEPGDHRQAEGPGLTHQFRQRIEVPIEGILGRESVALHHPAGEGGGPAVPDGGEQGGEAAADQPLERPGDAIGRAQHRRVAALGDPDPPQG